MSEPRPWGRRKGETAKAFAAFSEYLELGPDRSIAKVARELGRPAGYARHLEAWSSKHDWVARAREFDEHLAAKRLEARQEAIERAYGVLAENAEKAAALIVASIRGILPESALERELVALILDADADGDEVAKAEARYVPARDRIRTAIDVLSKLGIGEVKRVKVDNDEDSRAADIPHDRRIAALRALAGDDDAIASLLDEE